MLNYTQGKQLNLLKNIGFTSPSWQDLSYVLIGIVVAVSLVGAAWSLWERTQHDPWLRLLMRARKQLAKAGIESTAAVTPKQLAVLLRTQFGQTHTAPIQWLMQLEAQRYASSAQPSNSASHQQLKQLRQQFNALTWPG